jgi:hypothetical protein
VAERDGRAAATQAQVTFVTRVSGALLIAAAVATIYARSTSAYFFDDDFHWLEQTQAFALLNMLDLDRYQHFYRPVIEVYFYIGLSLFGCQPWPFHLTSIGLHLLTTLCVFQLGRSVATGATFAFLSALFFAIQPGLVDAVTWIAAITDLLPVLWYVAAVWAHILFLKDRRQGPYVASLTAFVLCHLTHESAATLLPMLLLTELTFGAAGSTGSRLRVVARHWASYLPHAVVLAAFLIVAYVVNTRSYLIQEGHYAIGWHALPNILNYVIWLYVGKRAWVDYVATLVTLGAAVVWGTPRIRYAIAWIVITLLPVAFFTWDNAPRYLYLPAVGFALLLADVLMAVRHLVGQRGSPRVAQGAMVAMAALLAIRFGIFAKKAADTFPERTQAYERFARELQRANPTATPGAAVTIDQRFLESVPELYREPAARVGLCVPGVRLEMR